MKPRTLLLGLLLPLLAADTPDPRGWSPGTIAAGAAAVLAGPAPVSLVLPDRIGLKGPTVLVYFSPTCPHCQHVAPELEALTLRLAGKAAVTWVASGASLQEDVDLFQKTFHITGKVVRDVDASYAAAVGARSTPTVVYARPGKGKNAEILDRWDPYAPGYDLFVEGRVTGDLWKGFTPDTYQGDRVCGECHTEETKGYQLTHHAFAWWSLVDQKKELDPTCNRCHVTGSGQPSGFDGTDTSDLVNVGCEACHGPGGPHDGKATDARAACATCHDAEHTIAFSLDKGLPLIDHFAANGLDTLQILEKRRAIANGSAPRPLLDFPQGKTLGAQACQSCHPAEVASWQKSPHAAAMTQLHDKAAADVDCVRCHATATESGPAPTDLAGFRTAESVSCESCHGPAEAHVAAAGKGPIEGLGDDCPVCVVEAVCTTCHTRTWDADWSLDPALKAIHH